MKDVLHTGPDTNTPVVSYPSNRLIIAGGASVYFDPALIQNHLICRLRLNFVKYGDVDEICVFKKFEGIREHCAHDFAAEAIVVFFATIKKKDLLVPHVVLRSSR